MIPIDLNYEFPFAIYISLFSLILIILCALLYSYRSTSAKMLGSSEVLKVILEPRANLIFWLKSAMLILLWVSAVIALMGPKGNARYPDELLRSENTVTQPNKPSDTFRPAHDVIILMDASASMEVKDSRSSMSRLELAKDVADQIISRLTGENVALQAFTSELTQLSPLTLDDLFVRMRLSKIEINEGNVSGTDYKAAFEGLKKRYFEQPSLRFRSIILFSDGGDTLYESLEGETKTERQKEILSYLDHAEEDHIRIFVVGMGSIGGGDVPGVNYQGQPVHSSMDKTLLMQIASHGRGVFYEANEKSAVEIAEDILRSMKQDNPSLEKTTFLRPQTNQFKIYDYYFQIPLAIAILLLLFVIFYRENRQKKISLFMNLLFLFSAIGLEAQTLSEGLQKASIFYEAEDYPKTLEVYNDMLALPLSDEQESLILYDMGSVYLASGENIKALALFKSINLGQNSNPLLLKELYLNEAVAYLNESLYLKAVTFDALNKKYFYLKESLDALDLAKKADCTLQQIEGSLKCLPPYDLFLIEETAKVYLSNLYDQIKIYINSVKATKSESALQKLLLFYKIVFLGDLISPHSLSLLQTEQNKINTSQNNQENLKVANEWLEKSRAALNENSKISQLFLLKAFHQIVILQRSSEEKHKDLPSVVLEWILEDQREALRIQRLTYEINQKNPSFAAVQENPQDFVLETAQSFIPIVKKYQINQFINNEKKTPEECCQAQPWDEVLPLFVKGYQYAKQASQLAGLQTLFLQEQALSIWMQVKEMLNKPVKPHTGSCFASRKAREEENPAKPEKGKMPSKKPSFEHVARELEKMDKADSGLLKAPAQSVKVERPW